jgi:LSD1 subclass zinc finger protein
VSKLVARPAPGVADPGAEAVRAAEALLLRPEQIRELVIESPRSEVLIGPLLKAFPLLESLAVVDARAPVRGSSERGARPVARLKIHYAVAMPLRLFRMRVLHELDVNQHVRPRLWLSAVPTLRLTHTGAPPSSSSSSSSSLPGGAVAFCEPMGTQAGMAVTKALVIDAPGASSVEVRGGVAMMRSLDFYGDEEGAEAYEGLQAAIRNNCEFQHLDELMDDCRLVAKHVERGATRIRSAVCSAVTLGLTPRDTTVNVVVANAGTQSLDVVVHDSYFGTKRTFVCMNEVL